MGTNHNLLRQTGLQKCGLLLSGGWLVSRIFEEFQHLAIQTKIVQHFGGFFRQIKVRQPIERKNSIRVPKKQEAGGIFVRSSSEL
jgi:hypothetical protein